MPENGVQVSILIVSYNTRDLTAACIASVLAFAPPGGQEVIVVDNASSDGSADAIARRFPDVRLIRSAENIGFARANNLAARQAAGSYLLLLNPDTIVLDDAVSKLLAFARSNPRSGMWGGRTLYADGSLNPHSCWRFMSLWSLFTAAMGLSSFFASSDLFNREAYINWSRDSIRRVDILVGCFLLIERALWERLQGFDGRFFMYAEEADLCYRAVRLGAVPLFTPDASIFHLEGASETVRAEKLCRLYTGKCTFIRKHWTKTRASAGIGLLKLTPLIRICAYAVYAAVTGNKRHRQAAGEWRRVWSARDTWERGYPADSI